MTHPPISDDAAAKLRATLGGAGGPTVSPPSTPSTPSTPSSGSVEPKWSVPALKARAREAVDPLVDRVRHELVTATEQDQAELRAEVAELKDLILRTRAEHAAELAALHEELAASRRT